MFIEDEELRTVFKMASQEHLQNLDNGLLHLEKYPDDQATLEALLRDAHSLKGDANMLGVKTVGTLAHQIEHILTQLKQRQITFSPDLSDRLGQGLSAIRNLVQAAVTGEPVAVNSFQVLALLMGETQPTASPTTTPIPTVPDSTPSPQVVLSQSTSSQFTAPETASTPTSLPEADLSAITSPQSISSPTLPETFPAPATSFPVSRADLFGSGYRIETIRVTTQSLDSLMMQAGELTVTKIRIAHRLADVEEIANLWEECSRELTHNRLKTTQNNLTFASNQRRLETHLEQLNSLLKSLQNALYEDTTRLEAISDELETGIRTLRLLPFSTIFKLFPRLVRDLARQEGKAVDLVIEGGETTADKRILEEMKDPLMHLLRNAIDHGIELPEERQQLGKPPAATILLRSYQTPTNIVVEIQDDGRGLNLDRIKQTALKRGLCREEDLATLTPNQIQSLIFSPGFSTAPLVTEVSGRGVGLDVVQTNIEKLKGTIQVDSSPGKGCLFRIQLSITLATAHVLIVVVQETPYAIPVEFIRTACLIQAEDVFRLEGRETILRDDHPISLAWLSDLLELSVDPNSHSFKGNIQQACVILQIGSEQLGLLVDTVIDEQDVVMKPQSHLLKRVRNISGATILGTGEVCMVLNPQDLLKSLQRSFTVSVAPLTPEAKQTVLLVEDSIATRTQEKRMLEAAGYEVVTAVDGSDGFNKLRTGSFAAVVSDVQMPNLDGLQLTAKIRQQPQYDELPIILVTTLASDEDKRRGAEAGANAYITKSNLNQEILLETLHRLI
jgi:two-component system chemotaxis sensor kinase CheA